MFCCCLRTSSHRKDRSVRPLGVCSSPWLGSFFFFFHAEDGIRDLTVTGVQTCALPISRPARRGGARRSLDRDSSAWRGWGDAARPRAAPPHRGSQYPTPPARSSRRSSSCRAPSRETSAHCSTESQSARESCHH